MTRLLTQFSSVVLWLYASFSFSFSIVIRLLFSVKHSLQVLVRNHLLFEHAKSSLDSRIVVLRLFLLRLGYHRYYVCLASSSAEILIIWEFGTRHSYLDFSRFQHLQLYKVTNVVDSNTNGNLVRFGDG